MDFTELLDLQPLPRSVLHDERFERLYRMKYFNPNQTQVFHALFHTEENVLIGSPTGSGKTIMAEFAVLRAFKLQPQRKVVYIAPMKAIAKERLADWGKRFAAPPLAKEVVEVTGDYTPDLETIMAADVLITTPEKWDGISRNWNNRAYVQRTCLVIFDEIHLLGQDRGPVIEVIVSRMNLIASKTGERVRMIGLSTAMANGGDVADWFNVSRYFFFNFRPHVRPVPITIYFDGFSEKQYCPRMATMNKPAYNAIKKWGDGKPVLVFVSSRRQTRLTALDLIAYALHDTGGEYSPFVKCTQDELQIAIGCIKDEYLAQSLQFGVGM
jgi:activating signal cointegrator complex subunit 3